MAYFRRLANGAVRAHYWEGGRQRDLPREAVRHLDGASDAVIGAFLASWEERRRRRGNGGEAAAGWTPGTSGLLALVDMYVRFLLDRGRTRDTARLHRYLLESRVIPYFTSGDPPLTDPALWRRRSARLCDHMLSLGDSASTISSANGAVRGFVRWLWEEGYLEKVPEIPLREAPPRARNGDTPLARPVTPGEVKEFASRPDTPRSMALAALLGYFFSLRPQELFAVGRDDIRLGEDASGEEACRVLRRHGMDSSMCINIWRQREDDTGKFVDPKADSRGMVACFDAGASEMIRKLLAADGDVGERGDNEPGSLVFPYHPRRLVREWARKGIPGITLKDLRRASIYWLGHHAGLPVVVLQAHARHAALDTTLLYTRRPRGRGAGG